MEENNKEVEYSGFVTPSLILDKSDTDNRGNIIDKYAKIEGQDGLLCGSWSKGFEDGLIHIYLMKPVPALINEREEWVMKQMLLKEPISYMPPPEQGVGVTGRTKQKTPPQPKKRLVLDPETKQFRMM